ncbi:MAG: TerB family tellurite resistance protein [Candidatus Cloacimonetes bacterium]|nr:TerB family tellurite resistance protein [Candidatus Cloacimonadota bacterium]
MQNWTKMIENTLHLAGKEVNKEHLLERFFESHASIPRNSQEEAEFAEFSLVTCSMALLIHVAKANKILPPEMQKRILNDLLFQLHQRPTREIQRLSAYGTEEKEMIINLYHSMMQQYDAGNLDIEGSIRAINLVYRHNPEKRNYLIRLCYYCACADGALTDSEADTIDQIARALHITHEDQQQIQQEAVREILG